MLDENPTVAAGPVQRDDERRGFAFELVGDEEIERPLRPVDVERFFGDFLRGRGAAKSSASRSDAASFIDDLRMPGLETRPT